jgi:hypothetical protein
MNRSILIVICDFLLLSLLTFSTDLNHMADENTRPPTSVAVATNPPPSADADLAAAMKLALAAEQKNREQLEQQLQQQLQQKTVAAGQASNATLQAQAQARQREQENVRLQQQLAGVQNNAENLSRQLQATTAQARESQQRLAATQTEAQRQAEVAAALQQQIDLLNRSNQMALTEKERLAGELQLAEVQQRAAADRAALMQQEVLATRAENARLAEGFQMLATNSGQLTQEIRENRALAPNTIFSEFVSNRIGAEIYAARTGLFGVDAGKTRNTETILVTDGTNCFALCHVQDTPLTLWDPGTDWDRLTGTLSGRGVHAPVPALAFDDQDPRVVMIPLTPAEAHGLGGKIYHLSSDPYKVQDAVLVGASEGYYGECNFQIDLKHPQYVRLDHSLLKGLFGKFNPSRGDLVFSRGDELLGIMVNDTYCLTIHQFSATTILPFDVDLHNQHTGLTLAGLYDHVFDLPLALQ